MLEIQEDQPRLAAFVLEEPLVHTSFHVSDGGEPVEETPGWNFRL